MRKVVWLVVGIFLLSAGAAMAQGPHDMDCMDCHSTHYVVGDYAFGVAPKGDAKNPARTRTGEFVTPKDALCLGCHNEDEGIMPVDMATTHPTSVRPDHTPVPERLLWEGTFVCVSCHDPHPSNENYKYLIVPTDGGQDMGVFCAVCHPGQSYSETVAAAKALTISYDQAPSPIIRVTPQQAAPKPAE